MNRKILIVVAFAAVLILGYTTRVDVDPESQLAVASPSVLPAKESMPAVIYPKATPDREAWLDKLVRCESHGDRAAVNPKDRDGTPSYGLLQFKPETFELFSKAYKIPGELMDPEAQRAIVRRMMDDPSIDWSIQFPVCTSILGTPPK